MCAGIRLVFGMQAGIRQVRLGYKVRAHAQQKGHTLKNFHKVSVQPSPSTKMVDGAARTSGERGLPFLQPQSKAKQREIERVAILAQVLHLCLEACAALLPGGGRQGVNLELCRLESPRIAATGRARSALVSPEPDRGPPSGGGPPVGGRSILLDGGSSW